MTLDELEKICDAATPGPWKYDWGNHEIESENMAYWRQPVCSEVSHSDRLCHITQFKLSSKLICPSDDMQLIEALRNKAPALLAAWSALKYIQREYPNVATCLVEDTIEELEKE